MVSDLVLTGRAMSAEEAYAHGVVSRVVPPEALDATVMEMAVKIAATRIVMINSIKVKPRAGRRRHAIRSE